MLNHTSRQHREVNMNLVPEDVGSYTLPKLSAEETNQLSKILIEHGEKNGMMPCDLMKKIAEAKHTANLSDLPEDHSAIKTHLIPSIKIVKNKPKDENNGSQNN